MCLLDGQRQRRAAGVGDRKQDGILMSGDSQRGHGVGGQGTTAFRGRRGDEAVVGGACEVECVDTWVEGWASSRVLRAGWMRPGD